MTTLAPVAPTQPSRSVMASSLLHGSLTAEPPGSRSDMCCNPKRTWRSVASEFRDHHHRLKLFSATQENARWPEVFGTSPWFPPQSCGLLVFRCLCLTIFLSMYVWSITSAWQDGFWWIYLTHWSLTLETVYFLFATFTTFQAWKCILDIDDPRRSTEPRKLPWFVRVTWILNHIEMPASLLVMCLKWTTVTPFWSLKEVPPFLDLFVHGINFLICLADLFVGRNVFYLPHALWIFGYSTLYMVFSVVHYELKIGSYTACTINGVPYPRDECPIYPVLDWRTPKATGIAAVIICLFVIPLFQFPIWWCVRSRRTADYFRHASERRQASEQRQALRAAQHA